VTDTEEVKLFEYGGSQTAREGRVLDAGEAFERGMVLTFPKRDGDYGSDSRGYVVGWKCCNGKFHNPKKVKKCPLPSSLPSGLDDNSRMFLADRDAYHASHEIRNESNGSNEISNQKNKLELTSTSNDSTSTSTSSTADVQSKNINAIISHSTNSDNTDKKLNHDLPANPPATRPFGRIMSDSRKRGTVDTNRLQAQLSALVI
jgi:hypothetical protein